METNKRGWIKNLIIIFLVLILIFTLFSNTFMNRSLPEVAVSNSESGTITTQVKLTGTVNANSVKQITLDYARKINEVLVRRGDTVTPGMVIATLVAGESPEIDNLEIELKQLQIEYKKMLVETEDSLITTRYQLEDAQKELAALNDYITALPTYDQQKQGYEDQIEVLKGQVKEKESVIKDLEKQMAKLENPGMSIEKLTKAITAAEAALSDAERNTRRAKARRTSALGTYTNANAAYTAAEKFYNDAVKNAAVLREELDTLKAQLNALKDERDALQKKVDELAALPDPTPEQQAELATAREALTGKKDEIRAKESEISAKENELAAAEKATATAKADYDEKYGIYNDASQKYNEADSAYDSCVSAEKTAQDNLDRLNEGWAYALLAERKTEREDEKAALDEELATAQETLDTFTKDNYRTDLPTLEDAEKKQTELTRTVEGYERQIRIAEANDAIDDETATLNLSIQRTKIAQKQREIEKIRGKAVSTEIKSTVSGTISTLNMTAGDEIAAGTTVAEIATSDGYTMECSVPNAQASRLRVGLAGEVQYYYWGAKPTVTVSTIKNDPNNSGKSKIVTLTVEGDIADGTSLTVTIGSQGSSYDCIVPNSAIQEDSDGKFILVVTSKSSPLGNRYYAQRKNVTVLASEATRSAIDASLSWGDYVITGATDADGKKIPISDGMQVRMAEK